MAELTDALSKAAEKAAAQTEKHLVDGGSPTKALALAEATKALAEAAAQAAGKGL